MTITSTVPLAASLDGLPDSIRDQVGKLLDGHHARTARYRDTLLKPGGPDLEVTTYGDGSRSHGPAATEALAAANRWWQETVTFTEQLLDLDRDQADALAPIAGDELSAVLRGRLIILAELAAGTIGRSNVTGPQIEDDGVVLVAGVRVPLTGVVAAGPPPQAPEIHVSISTGAAVADVVARIRAIADQIETTGSYT
ncbi:hypothetical protein FF36_05338 [Frankia torreyi]|uniref:Uncharacterized protein n=1 Tax=Frankia torreyi TaxID=1856 RepID=A0A0D8B8W8_9ACTN|nr:MULTISPECIES: hypothetical protein [Frankia]KJE20364.1 hypothetical protein FF36_05338 [Frankia torreyi]